MKGVNKNREQLIGELDTLRQHVVGLDKLEAERKKVEGELKKYRYHLEELVKDRTAELAKANEQLQKEINERKRAEEQLIVTDRLASIGELASGIAHELNNPLTGVIGFSELLLEKNVPNEIREDIAIINHEAMRAAEVVKNLLTFARKHTPYKETINVNGIIASVLALRAYEQKVSNIKVITRFDRNLLEFMADSFQLQQVFLNIIINAEYSMEEAHKGGILTIKTEKEEDIIRATFTDDGLGISKETWGIYLTPSLPPRK